MRADYSLLVFDWDGTLMDSQARIVRSIEAAIADLGLAPRTPDAIRDIIGLGLAQATEVLYPGSGEALAPELAARYRRHFFGSAEASSLFPGTALTMQRLREQGYELAIATGKSRAGLERDLDATGVRALFSASRCADETCSKPDPQMLLEVIEEMGVSPAAAIMIGDTEYDLQMARSAEVDAIAVTYGAHERRRLLQFQPLISLDAIIELPAGLAAIPG